MKIINIICLVIISACLVVMFYVMVPTDKLGIDGSVVKVNGKYYRLENRIGNSYVLESIKDTIR